MTIELPRHIEDSIIAKIHSGLFPSMDVAMTRAAMLLLERIEQEQAMKQVPPPSQEAAAPASKPAWERILDITADVPDAVWDTIPTDLAEQHDHYLYGTPKRTRA